MKLPIEYVAGLIDADGSFSISLQTKGAAIFNARFVVNYRSVFEGICEDVQETLDAGTIYECKSKNLHIWSWQSVKMGDALKVARLLYPHLRIKQDISKIFADLLEEWIEASFGKGRGSPTKGKLHRPKELVERVLKTMVSLNKSVQTESYWSKRQDKIDALRQRIEDAYK